MDPVFAFLEATSLSRWLRESSSVLAFPAILTLHTVGLAFLAGPSAAIDLRILGVARGLALRPLTRFYPLMWAGFWLNAATGALLVLAYPTKALTNPLFYLKLVLIALALWTLQAMRSRVLESPTTSAQSRGPVSDSILLPFRARLLASVSLLLWVATIFSGRWLAYTYRRLLVDF
jgi:hypothetical protein